MISSDQIFSKKQQLPLRVIDDEIVIVDLAGNNVLQLNNVGRCIWEQINGERAVTEIAKRVSAEYRIDSSQANSDTLRVISTLATKKLICEKKSAD